MNADSGFSFTRFCDLSPYDIERIFHGGTYETLQHINKTTECLEKLNHLLHWSDTLPIKSWLLVPSIQLNQLYYSTLENLIFTYWVRAKSC